MDRHCPGEWEYRQHQCIVTQEIEWDDDNIKLWHEVIKPDGTRLFADISPYDHDPATLELWIDAGYPHRISCGPLNQKDLHEIIDSGNGNSLVTL